MKTNKTMNKIKETILKSLKELLHSFKEKKIILAFIYDAVFILVAGIILKAASQILLKRMNALGITQATTPELMVQNMALMKQFMYTTGITAILLYIVLLAAYTISRGMIWTKIQDKQLTKKYLLKFGLLNLVWIPAWILAFALLITITNQEYYKWIMIVLGIAYIHLTTILHHTFTHKNEIGNAVQKAFSTGLGRIHKIILQYIYIIIIFIAIGQILSIATQAAYGKISITASSTIGIAVLVLFLAWYRTYLSKTISKE